MKKESNKKPFNLPQTNSNSLYWKFVLGPIANLYWYREESKFLKRRVILQVLKERKYQIQLWGKQTYKNPLYWLGILTEEVGEFAQAVNETVLDNAKKKHLGGADNMVKELIQVAAVAVAAAEDILEQKENKNGRK